MCVTAVDHRSGGIHHGNFLSAGSAFAAIISRLPSSSLIPYTTLFRSGVGNRAQDGDHVGPAVVGRCRRVKGGRGTEFSTVIGVTAGDYRGGGIDNRNFLAAGSAIAARISRMPGPGRIKSRSTVTDGVG